MMNLLQHFRIGIKALNFSSLCTVQSRPNWYILGICKLLTKLAFRINKIHHKNDSLISAVIFCSDHKFYILVQQINSFAHFRIFIFVFRWLSGLRRYLCKRTGFGVYLHMERNLSVPEQRLSVVIYILDSIYTHTQLRRHSTRQILSYPF